MPKISAAATCQTTMVRSGVPRSERVTIIRKAKKMLPSMATSGGQPKDIEDGCSAMTTPANPTRIAVQRRQPTRSPRISAASSVT